MFFIKKGQIDPRLLLNQYILAALIYSWELNQVVKYH